MRQVRASIPFAALFAITRGILGIGVGLLLAERMRRRQRRIGKLLAAAGVASTVPFAVGMIRNMRRDRLEYGRRERPEYGGGERVEYAR